MSGRMVAIIVVLVDEERLDDDEDLVHKRAHQVVELVEDAVDDLDEQVALLVLEGGRHEQRQDLVEQRARAELARLVAQLPERPPPSRLGCSGAILQTRYVCALLM